MITIHEPIYQAMIEHMRQAAPAEGVGLLAGATGGGPLDHWTPLRNVSDFPRLRYETSHEELIAAWETLEGVGRRPWIVAHSHTTTTAAPSQLDIRYAVDPTLLHMIVSVHGPQPVGALWRIDPDARGVRQVERVGYRVADLHFHPKGTTDLTHDVSGA